MNNNREQLIQLAEMAARTGLKFATRFATKAAGLALDALAALAPEPDESDAPSSAGPGSSWSEDPWKSKAAEVAKAPTPAQVPKAVPEPLAQPTSPTSAKVVVPIRVITPSEVPAAKTPAVPTVQPKAAKPSAAQPKAAKPSTAKPKAATKPTAAQPKAAAKTKAADAPTPSAASKAKAPSKPVVTSSKKSAGNAATSGKSNAAVEAKTADLDSSKAAAWTDAETKQLIDLWNAHSSHQAISDAINRPLGSVKSRIRGLTKDGLIEARKAGRRPKNA